MVRSEQRARAAAALRSPRGVVLLALSALVVLCAGLVVAYAVPGEVSESCRDALQEVASRLHLPEACHDR